jgi:hypothetical protein
MELQIKKQDFIVGFLHIRGKLLCALEYKFQYS